MEDAAINPTVEPLSWRPTNRRTIIPKKLLHCYKSSRTQSRFPNLGIQQRGLESPTEFDFGGQWDLITKLLQDWGNRLLEGTNKTLCAPGARRKEQWSHKRLRQPCLWVFKSLWWRHGLTLVRCTTYNSAGLSTFEGGRYGDWEGSLVCCSQWVANCWKRLSDWTDQMLAS